eukprot:1427434-Rhodomonas_salina.1
MDEHYTASDMDNDQKMIELLYSQKTRPPQYTLQEIVHAGLLSATISKDRTRKARAVKWMGSLKRTAVRLRYAPRDPSYRRYSSYLRRLSSVEQEPTEKA